MIRPMIRLLVALSVLPLFAYNPPQDTAGPLTVRLAEPALGAYGAGGLAEFRTPGVPAVLPVMLENSGAVALRGTLRVRVIDGWSVSPSLPVSFSVAPRGRARLEFTISFAAGTYNAHYPVHAYAEFDHEGRHYVAHPVLILKTMQPDPPRAHVQAPWTPVKVRSNGGLALWRVQARRTSVRVEEEAGGRETYETAPVVQFGAHSGREGIGMTLGPRPPSMRERIAEAFIEYPVELPSSRPLRLRYASSGAARYRVAVDGKTVADSTGGPGWKDAEANLDEFAGRSIVLRLGAEPLDAARAVQAWWGEPTIVAGAPSEQEPGVARNMGRAGEYDVAVRPGQRGILDSAVEFHHGAKQLSFTGFRVSVLGDRLDDWRSPTELLDSREEKVPGHFRLRQRFRCWAGDFDLVSDLRVEGPALQASFRIENAPLPKPWIDVHIEEIATGPWSQTADRIYAGNGNVIVKPQAFQQGFDGHRLATSFVGFDFANGISLVQGVDVSPDRLEVDPGRHIYTLSTPHTQTVTFLPVSDVWSGIKAWRAGYKGQPSAGVGKLAGRFVFDIWNGRYGDSARGLARAFRYGLTNSAVVWHSWQRWGYDYRLPDIYPPNPQFGTEEEFRTLVETCRRNGVFFAPHDNYIDFYPDSDDFSYSNIAFDPNGTPRRAWFNNGRQAQSYRARADRLRPFLERNVKMIRDGFAPDAYFIDVWSSAGPYDYWTGDGKFVDRGVTRRVWGESFAWIRDFLKGAVQISEAGHDQLIGWLDGAQAQHLRVDPKPGNSFVWSIRAEDAERIPWIDAAYHDLFVLHGAGYPGRYEGGLDPGEHGIYSDDYMATEVLTGHPGMVPAAFHRNVVRKYWLLDGLMRSLALDRIAAFSFDGGDIHRQRVRWTNGAEVWVNRGASPWMVAGHTLPPFGFYAKFPQGEIAVEQRGASTVEWSRSAAAWYENDRAAVGFRVDRDGAGVRLTPLPDGGRFTARVPWKQLPWQAPLPSRAVALDEGGKTIGEAAVRTEADVIVVDCAPGVFAYRLR